MGVMRQKLLPIVIAHALAYATSVAVARTSVPVSGLIVLSLIVPLPALVLDGLLLLGWIVAGPFGFWARRCGRVIRRGCHSFHRCCCSRC